MEIYRKLMKYRTTDSMLKSVEDVTDPTKKIVLDRRYVSWETEDE